MSRDGTSTPPEQKCAQAIWLRASALQLLPGVPVACWLFWSSGKKKKKRAEHALMNTTLK